MSNSSDVIYVNPEWVYDLILTLGHEGAVEHAMEVMAIDNYDEAVKILKDAIN